MDTDLKTEVSSLKQMVASLTAALEKSTKPATNNAGDLAGQASAEAQRGAVESRPVVELLDAHKGKGLKFARVMRALAWQKTAGASFEQACKQFKLPEDSLSRLHEMSVSKSLAEGGLAGGGALDPDRYAGEVIEVLRPKLAFLAAGVMDVPMEGQSLTLPRQATDVAGAWIGESQNAPVTGPSFDTIQLDLKKYGALVPVSRDLLRDAVVAADIIVRNSLIEQSKRALDIACLRGAGTKYTPRGVRFAAPSANVFASAAGSGTNTLATAQSDLTQLLYRMEAADVQLDKPVYFFNPRFKRGLSQLRDGTGRPYYPDLLEKKAIEGTPFFDTTALPINLSGGGSGGSVETELIAIDAAQWLLGIGMMPSVEVSTEAGYIDAAGNPQNAFQRDEMLIRVLLRSDVQPRHLLACAVATGNTLTP